MLILKMKFVGDLIVKKVVDSIIKSTKNSDNVEVKAYSKIIELKKAQYKASKINMLELVAAAVNAKYNIDNNQTFMPISNEEGMNNKYPIEEDIACLLHRLLKENNIAIESFDSTMDFVIKNMDKEFFIHVDTNGDTYLAYYEKLKVPKEYSELIELKDVVATKIVLNLENGIQFFN